VAAVSDVGPQSRASSAEANCWHMQLETKVVSGGPEAANTHLAGEIDLDGLDADVLGTGGHIGQVIGDFGGLCWETKTRRVKERRDGVFGLGVLALEGSRGRLALAHFCLACVCPSMLVFLLPCFRQSPGFPAHSPPFDGSFYNPPQRSNLDTRPAQRAEYCWGCVIYGGACASRRGNEPERWLCLDRLNVFWV